MIIKSNVLFCKNKIKIKKIFSSYYFSAWIFFIFFLYIKKKKIFIYISRCSHKFVSVVTKVYKWGATRSEGKGIRTGCCSGDGSCWSPSPSCWRRGRSERSQWLCASSRWWELRRDELAGTWTWSRCSDWGPRCWRFGTFCWDQVKQEGFLL